MSADRLVGASAPLDPTGSASLYGPPPWHFAGCSLTVIARCDAAAVAALIPAPLRPWGEPLVRFSVHWLACDLGFGRAWAQAHPEASQFHEAVVGIAVEDDAGAGYWDPFLWCDSDAELAVGREVYGWPQRQGTIALTRPHAIDGWQAGDRVTGLVSRLGRPVFEARAKLEGPGELDVPTPAFVRFFTERALPDPVSGRVVRELFASEMADMRRSDVWRGDGELDLTAPELAPLRPQAIVGARWNRIAWTKQGSTLVARREQAVTGQDDDPRGRP